MLCLDEDKVVGRHAVGIDTDQCDAVALAKIDVHVVSLDRDVLGQGLKILNIAAVDAAIQRDVVGFCVEVQNGVIAISTVDVEVVFDLVAKPVGQAIQNIGNTSELGVGVDDDVQCRVGREEVTEEVGFLATCNQDVIPITTFKVVDTLVVSAATHQSPSLPDIAF